MPLVISSILSIISSVMGSITTEQQQKLQLALQANDDITKLVAAQTAVDEAEASNPNMYVAGWRPLVGWVCALYFAWKYLILSMILYFCALTGHAIPLLPCLNDTVITQVLMGMLGLGWGSLRSWEKWTNCQNNH